MSEDRMELFIETLTGTAFELSCSPLETIVSIKAKIQYSEGIPVSQQHLIWKSQELSDDLCLQDYHINDGATLKLVLGMRGGPINTRQISDPKKLKDIAEYVERRSETSGSSGRPFTVLVFHDGDKVHMYTVMERGDCAVSPISGTISDASSVASLKNVEEFDQEFAKENEITKEKMSHLQEQIRALNINRSKRFPVPSSQAKENVTIPKVSVDDGNFHLPPLQRVDSIDSQTKQYSHRSSQHNFKKVDNNYFSRFAPDVGNRLHRERLNETKHNSKYEHSENSVTNSRASSTLDSISGKISYKVRSPQRKNSSDTVSVSCSSFLPNIEPMPGTSVPKKSSSTFSTPNAQYVELNLNSSCTSPVLKYDLSKVECANSQCPLTSSQTLFSERFSDLEHWMKNRPKTTPEGSLSRALVENELFSKNKLIRDSRLKNKMKRSIKSPLSVSLASGDRSSLMMDTYTNHNVSYDVPSTLPSKNKSSLVHSHSKTDVGTFITAGLKALKAYSPPSEAQENVSKQNSTKSSPKANEETSRPSSGRKLPIIKAKKKSYKRCSLCSKRTGLATSYSCRCGKNFCAPHRYAEVHHCSYDYKTEGRRLLQLNNPVVAASKLPKI